MVFAKEPEHFQMPRAVLGEPLKTLSEGWFVRLVRAAGVRRINVATLLLQASVPVRVVAARLGHQSASMTLDVNGHVLPSAQQDVATRLGAVLHG